MGPLSEPEFQTRIAGSEQVKHYAQSIDRESARELLAARMGGDAAGRGGDQAQVGRDMKAAPVPGELVAGIGSAAVTIGAMLNSPMGRMIAGQVTRSLLGALVGPPRRRRRY
jgi:hypothetical protein